MLTHANHTVPVPCYKDQIAADISCYRTRVQQHQGGRQGTGSLVTAAMVPAARCPKVALFRLHGVPKSPPLTGYMFVVRG
jgi:hypothetical protein